MSPDTRVEQYTLSCVVEVSPGQEDALRRCLGDLAPDASRLFCGRGVHFARWVLLRPQEETPARLLLESNFDLPPGVARAAASRAHLCAHLRALCIDQREVFQEIYGHCRGAPPPGKGGPDGLARYLLAAEVEATASYQGHPGRSVERILLEDRLRGRLASAVHARDGWGEPALFDALRDEAAHCFSGELDLDTPAPGPSLAHRVAIARGFSRTLIRALFGWLGERGSRSLATLLAPVYNPFNAALDPAQGPAPYPDLDAQEGQLVQNQLTHVTRLRRGPLRGTMLRNAHALLRRLVDAHFHHLGRLGNIPTIHFARWILIDGGRTLVFTSNYDGSWESYLGDFVDGAATGLNLAWNCTEGYPQTRGLAGGGAHNEQAFKRWARDHQVPTELFFSAYGQLTVSAINNNSQLRSGLHEQPADLLDWFTRLA